MTQQSPDLKTTADQLGVVASSWGRYRRSIGRTRTARGCIKVGIQLLLLKQATPHGSFLSRINELGISARRAGLCMAAARRFRDAPDAFFDAVGTASKLEELLPWDGADALADGKNVGRLTLGLVAQMTRNELRAEIRFQKGKSIAPVQAPSDPSRAQRLAIEEECMLNRYRKCNAEGRAALMELAGLLAQAPT